MPRTIEFKGSSNIKQATLADDGTCAVTFANGQVVSYRNITPELMTEWEGAESAGRWFHNRIRSKPAEFPPVDASPASAPGTLLPEKPEPKAEAAASTPASDGGVARLEGQVAALKTEITRVTKQRDELSTELENLRARTARVVTDLEERLKRATTTAGGPPSTTFRPWRKP